MIKKIQEQIFQKPDPHPTKAIFQSHNVPISAVANALGLSYPYVSNMLSGTIKPTGRVDSELRKLSEMLEAKER